MRPGWRTACLQSLAKLLQPCRCPALPDARPPLRTSAQGCVSVQRGHVQRPEDSGSQPGLQGTDSEKRYWELALGKRNADYRLLHAKLLACKAEASDASQEASAQAQSLQAQVQQLQVGPVGQGRAGSPTW